ncbi:MAG: DUF4349 domain-containing protein [Theionarchaea archaeon]|nr:DUF4349 domain-containing protein [Theionarchaea archaeon]
MNRRKIMLILGIIFVATVLMLTPFLDVKEEEDLFFEVDTPYFNVDTPNLEEEREEVKVVAESASRSIFLSPWVRSFNQKDTDVSVEEKLIKSSVIYLEVEIYDEVFTRIKEIVSLYKGYISESDERDSEGWKYGYIIIRVPREYFEAIIEDLKALGEVDVAKITVQDVTEEYVDLEARLTNLKKQEERYLEVLAVATTVDEILKVENQLERIRGDIESYEGKMRYLDDSIDYATIRVDMKEPETEKFEIGLGDALRRAFQAFFSALRAVIIFLGYLIPLVFVFGLLYMGGRVLHKRFFQTPE